MAGRFAVPPRRPAIRTLATRGAVAALVLLAACSRDRDRPQVTDSERAAYAAPADSTLTPAQVDLYLQTALAQLELIEAEAPGLRGEIAAAPETAPPAMKRWSDFLAATYVRAARRVGANPAEMEFVGARMHAVGTYLGTRASQASGKELAAILRAQAEGMRGTPGANPALVEGMLKQAEQAESQTVDPAPPRLQQNLDVLRRERANVSDATWTRIGRVSGGIGLMALGDMSDTTSTGVLAQLGEIRSLFEAALENRAP